MSAPTSVDAAVIVLPWDADTNARSAAQHLRTQLDLQSRVYTTTLASDIAAMLKVARASWSERWAIVLDTPRARVAAVRLADGTVLSRAIDPAIARDAPYAVAVTALELFDLARDVKGAAIVDDRETRKGEGNAIGLSLAIDGSFAISASPGHEEMLAQPMFGAAVVLRGSETKWWVSFGARARVFGGQDLVRGGAPLHYERIDAELRLMLGRTEEPFELALAIDGGGSSTNVVALDESGAKIAEDARLLPWIGGGIEARLRFFGGGALSLGAGGLLVPRPTRYRVRSEVFLEGSIRLIGSIGLVWELG
jgi:hypothetical protein